MAPLLGLLGFAGSIPGRVVTDSYRFIRTFLGDILSHSRVVFTVDYLFTCMFFFQNRPLEESPHRSCRAFEEKSILVFPECLEASEW
jgi:hypothetical protein